MKLSDLKKDAQKSVRLNSDVLQQIIDKYGSLQVFLDLKLEEHVQVTIEVE